MANEIELDSIEYNGKEYPCRDVYIDKEVGTINVSVESLSAALNPNDDWDSVDHEAGYIDSKVYFYVPDEMITKPIKELTKYVKDNS